jgi:hypothetical protein
MKSPITRPFPKNRHGRFRGSSLFRWLFNEVLRRCMDAGDLQIRLFQQNRPVAACREALPAISLFQLF